MEGREGDKERQRQRETVTERQTEKETEREKRREKAGGKLEEDDRDVFREGEMVRISTWLPTQTNELKDQRHSR